jgi:site-specific recombinase XerD
MEGVTGDLFDQGFVVHLQARKRSPRTIANYRSAVASFTVWCAEHGRPTDPAQQARRDLEGYLADELARGAAVGSVALRFRALRRWFRWLADEGEVERDPSRGMVEPRDAGTPVPVLDEAQLRALFGTCRGRDWMALRDLALLRFLVETGVRLGELVGLDVGDVDVAAGTARVKGKTGTRDVWFGPTTAEAIARYLRARARRPGANRTSGPLWVTNRQGSPRLSDAGVQAMVRTRGEQAGLGRVHPHMFRHTQAHRWLAAGGTESGLMTTMGWRSRQMLQRYGASAAAVRAAEEARRLGLGEGL